MFDFEYNDFRLNPEQLSIPLKQDHTNYRYALSKTLTQKLAVPFYSEDNVEMIMETKMDIGFGSQCRRAKHLVLLK